MTATYVLIAAAGRGARFNTDPSPQPPPLIGKGEEEEPTPPRSSAPLPKREGEEDTPPPPGREDEEIGQGDRQGRLSYDRMGEGARNKVFAPLLGRPILRWTVEAFAGRDDVDGIVVVTGAHEVAEVKSMLAGVDKVMSILAGGASRQESVYIGLSALAGGEESLIVVHDAARPLVDADTIDRCLRTARALGNAVAAAPVVDTLKSAGVDNVVTGTVDREGLFAVQTPQVFRWSTLAKAHLFARDVGFAGTDEASVVEHAGVEPVNLVVGSPENLKITRPGDLRIAEALLQDRINRSNSGGIEGSKPGIMELMKQAVLSDAILMPRIGFGYDIHRFAPGRRLVLGGVEFEPVDGRGLDGHSDADVLLHAICDALLGAAALPDIGHLFPNTDPAYAGISSLRLLEEVGNRLTAQGASIVNVDATVIAERPKIGPAIPRMRESIAGALGIDGGRVGIKATTNEGLGSIGDGMGIAAHAVAAVLFAGG